MSVLFMIIYAIIICNVYRIRGWPILIVIAFCIIGNVFQGVVSRELNTY